jgi:hypothetical protein
MKKSVKYSLAMRAVLESGMDVDVKLEIIETLLDNRSTAEWVEKQEEKKNG